MGVIWQNICSFIRLARQKIDWGGVMIWGALGWEGWRLQRNNVSLTVLKLLLLEPRLRRDRLPVPRDKNVASSPFTSNLNLLTAKKNKTKYFFLQFDFVSNTDVSTVCALTEEQGNYWNIWMAAPPLDPLANDAWLLQKGMGRTLLPLTDV